MAWSGTGQTGRAAQRSSLQLLHPCPPAQSVNRRYGRLARCETRRLARQATPSSDVSVATPDTRAFQIQDKVAFLREDLQHLFDDQGIDASEYADVVDFVDPITKYSDLRGYLFNIAFLRKAFDPRFILHDIQATSDVEVTARWTMQMALTPLRATPAGRWWDPTIIFTGTSQYVYDPDTSKICRHIDKWDSIDNQKYFSIEGFADFLGQVFQFVRTPQLHTPSYTVVKRYRAFQVRRYEPFAVAQAPLDAAAPPTASGSADPAAAGTGAFRSLAGYLFGGNARGAKLAMTTPVFTDTDGNMAFVLDTATTPASKLPAPAAGSCVQVCEREGGVWAAAAFSGVATPTACRQQESDLRRALQTAGLRARDGWVLARYNDPGTPPPFRRNEVLVQLEEFSLW